MRHGRGGDKALSPCFEACRIAANRPQSLFGERCLPRPQLAPPVLFGSRLTICVPDGRGRLAVPDIPEAFARWPLYGQGATAVWASAAAPGQQAMRNERRATCAMPV